MIIINPFKFSNSNKRYHTLAYHNWVVDFKSQKAVIDAGLTCPNIDGTCGVGGCRFCDGGSGYFTNAPLMSISEQIKLEKERIYRKNPDSHITAYFQSHTNTYCSVEKLKEMLEEAIGCGGVDAVSVATRPDCLDEEKIKLLHAYSQKTLITVELGLQTIFDSTANWFNRGYNYNTFEKAYNLLKKYNIRVCVHLINGLKGETKEMMVESARIVGRLRPDAVKIHLLHVIKGTRLAEDYLNGDYSTLDLEEYIDTVISQLEVLPPETIIERITGDGDKNKLLAPLWSKDKIRVLGTIDKELFARNTMQGRLYLAE